MSTGVTHINSSEPFETPQTSGEKYMPDLCVHQAQQSPGVGRVHLPQTSSDLFWELFYCSRIGDLQPALQKYPVWPIRRGMKAMTETHAPIMFMV